MNFDFFAKITSSDIYVRVKMGSMHISSVFLVCLLRSKGDVYKILLCWSLFISRAILIILKRRGYGGKTTEYIN